MTASLFSPNERSASRQLLVGAAAVPPSEPSAAGAGSTCALVVIVAPGSCQLDPRVRECQRDISRNIAQYRQRAVQQGVGEQHRVVVALQAVEEQQTEAGVV